MDITLSGTIIQQTSLDDKAAVSSTTYPIRKVLLWNIAEQRFVEAPALGLNTDGYEG